MNTPEKHNVSAELRRFTLFLDYMREPYTVLKHSVRLLSHPRNRVLFKEQEVLIEREGLPQRRFFYKRFDMERAIGMLRTSVKLPPAQLGV